jgi:hypothetical protein
MERSKEMCSTQTYIPKRSQEFFEVSRMEKYYLSIEIGKCIQKNSTDYAINGTTNCPL